MKTYDGTMDNIPLKDLIDVRVFQALSESFTRLTGLATAIGELNGKVLTASGWQKICVEFHRQHPATALRCRESDMALANQTVKGQNYNVYQCKNGLVEVSVPIIIENIHLGNLFAGQFFFTQPDIDLFSIQAEEFGFDKERYLDALKLVPVLSTEKVKQAMEFLSDLTAVIANSGIDKKQLYDLNRNLETKIAERTAEIRDEKKFSESFIRSLPGIMYVFDHTGHFKRWNRNLEVVSGYSATQIEKISPLALFKIPEDKQRIRQAIVTVFQGGSASVEAEFTTSSGEQIPYLFTGYKFVQNDAEYLVGVGLDISDRVRAEKEKEILIGQLQEMLSQVRQLSGFLPICAGCKKIRDDEGYWSQVEAYISKHTNTTFSHGLCPECFEKAWKEFEKPEGV